MEWMFQVHVILVLVWIVMGSHGCGGTSIYIKYPDRGEDII